MIKTCQTSTHVDNFMDQEVFSVEKRGCIAQSVEQLAFNQLAVGSSPTVPRTLYVFSFSRSFNKRSLAGMRNWLSRQAHNLKNVGSNPTSAQF